MFNSLTILVVSIHHGLSTIFPLYVSINACTPSYHVKFYPIQYFITLIPDLSLGIILFKS